MTSPSNNHQNPNMCPKQTFSRPSSPHSPQSSNPTHNSSANSPNASQYSSCSSPTAHPPDTNIALASTLIMSRFLSTAAQNPFLPIVAQPSSSTSRDSLNSNPHSPPIQFNPNLTSPLSSEPQSPLISPRISPVTSLGKEKENQNYRQVEMVPSPMSLCKKGNIDFSYAKPTSENGCQDSNDGDVDMKSIEACQTENSNQEAASAKPDKENGNNCVSQAMQKGSNSMIGTLTGNRTYAAAVMKSALPSPIFNSPSRSMSPDILLKKRLIRGLENSGNTCFINSILQSLMSCDPFRELALSVDVEKGTLLEKFSNLAWQMTEEASPKSADNDFSSEAPLMPKPFFGIFKPAEAIADKHSGTQEDAEEFLSFMLNQLQDQEVARIRNRVPGTKTDECNSGWQNGVQGQRFVDTNISNLFGGSSVSEVRRRNQMPSLTEASFFSLSLDVDLDCVNSISEALNNYCATEVLSNGIGIDGIGRIEKQVFLTVMPKILILHLKRFAYDPVTLAPKKVAKEIKFPELLEVPDTVLRPTEDRLEAKRSYELMAAVTHLGARLTGGHYYCDVRFRKRDGSSVWVKCSDEVLNEVELEEVLRRNAYILFYCQV